MKVGREWEKEERRSRMVTVGVVTCEAGVVTWTSKGNAARG